MDKPTLHIAVTGLNAIDNPGPGVGVIRSVRSCDDFKTRIIGLSYESMEPGAYLHDVVDKTYQVPYPSAGSDPLLQRLAYIHSVEGIDLIIPNFDSELRNFIRISPQLRQMGIRMFLPTADQLELVAKHKLHEFAGSNGFKVPKTIMLNSFEDIDKVEGSLEYPVFVKGAFYGAEKAVNKGQIIGSFHKLSAKWGLPVIIQETVEGMEIDICGLGDGKGNMVGAVPMRKLFITDRGKGWSGVVLEDDQLIDVTRQYVEATRWRGGFELEFVRDKDDTLYLLEVNPRFPAWVYTTVGAGQNLPAALVKLGMDLPVEPFKSYRPGTMFVRYTWEVITHIREFQQLSTRGEL
jgi:carbamoyl-phosphate synthase large subunit